MKNQWELYSTMKGCEQANQELDVAFRKTLVRSFQLLGDLRVTDTKETIKALETAILECWIPVVQRHRKLGAQDTEPRDRMKHLLIKEIERHYSVSIDFMDIWF